MRTCRYAIVVLFAVAGLFLLLAGRCFYLQYYRTSYYSGSADTQLYCRVIEKPCRGTILDRRGRVLAASNQIKNVFVEPRAVTDTKQTALKLAEILDKPAHEICKALTESRNPGYARVACDVESDVLSALTEANIRAVGIESTYSRYYPTGALAAHVAGFTALDGPGLGGVELAYDQQLCGSDGRQVFLADAFRRPIRLQAEPACCDNGVGVLLTVDATIQQITRSELMKQYKKYRAESAVAIVMQPDTGAVLAMVSLPDFDPHNLGSADPNALRNRALTDPFEPGSVLKPIAAAVALDAGVVTPTDHIFCEMGDYRGRGFGRIGEYGNHHFGDLTVREILIKSSNIGMAKIGQRLGKERLYTGLKLFGFGRQTGIDLPGEDAGLLWPPGDWTGYSVTRIPFGQEISVTAIQVVRAFSIIANGGRFIQPHVVKALVDETGKVIKFTRPAGQSGYVVKPAVAQWIVRQALTGVVKEGTGKKAALEQWQVFGKTGTANIARADGKGYSDEYIASFVGGAPADTPQVVVLVSIRRPDRSLGKGYTGGTVAAPVVGEILRRTLTYMRETNL